MPYCKANANYIFNVSYLKDAVNNSDMAMINREAIKAMNDSVSKALNADVCVKTLNGTSFETIQLKTEYPGTLIGTGNTHSSGAKGEMELGFTFDYVTGLPYLPGSSLKGLLRNAFSYPEYIKEVLEDDNIDVKKLETQLFGRMGESVLKNQARFLDSYIIGGTKRCGMRYLGTDSITPHNGSPLQEPNPITMIRINPEVIFEFRFIPAKNALINSEEQKNLFRTIICDFGVGAKTHVGYGLLSEVKS